MTTAEPLHSPNLPDLIRETVAAAREGDHRARHVTIATRSGIVTPHTDEDGNLDAADLAAQVWAIAHDAPSDNGHYTDGIFTSRGTGHIISAPPED